MANFSPSFFTRLYGSIILAVIVSIMLTQYFVDNLFEQDAVNDFIRDTNYIYRDLNKQIADDPLVKFQQLVVNPPFSNEFNISWQIVVRDGSSPCGLCEYITNIEDIEVYQLSEDGLLAVYFFEKLNAKLLISDKVDSPFFDENDSQEIDEFTGLNVEELAFTLFTVIVLMVLAGTIYWPVRKLQKQINALVVVNQRFGAGEMQVRSSEALTKPLNELAFSFNHMANAIENTVQENQIFSQAVLPGVQTPLSRIQLAVGLLRKNNHSTKHLELLGNIDSYIGDIDELIAQVVAFSRLNSSVNEDRYDDYQSIMFLPFIESRIAATNFNQLIKVKLLVEESVEITTNPVYLRLLIDNLLNNARSHARSKVTILVLPINGCIELSIEDDGIGIPSEFFATIFLPFARLDKSRSRKTGGLGLGLAIAKAASKRMQSDLIVENNEQGGAKFICKFLTKEENFL